MKYIDTPFSPTVVSRMMTEIQNTLQRHHRFFDEDSDMVFVECEGYEPIPPLSDFTYFKDEEGEESDESEEL